MSGLKASLGWAHLMRSYVTGGDAARLGRDATTALVVLSAHTDLATGAIDGLAVVDIAAAGGMARKAALAALAALVAAGYAERLDDGTRGRRAVWRLRHRAPLLDGEGRQVAVATWPYVPNAEACRHEQLKGALKAAGGGVPAAPQDISITVHQHITVVQQSVATGGTGIINVGGRTADDPDLVGQAVAWLVAASAPERMRWHKEAVSRGAPAGSTIRPEPGLLAAWASWVADDVCREAGR
jgi:hypothetical protein